jgi:hypothetical protein
MRIGKISARALDQLNALLAQVKNDYHDELLRAKKALVFEAMHSLAHQTDLGFTYVLDSELQLHRFTVRHTPFLLFYSISEHEVIIELVLHQHTDRADIKVEQQSW